MHRWRGGCTPRNKNKPAGGGFISRAAGPDWIDVSRQFQRAGHDNRLRPI